MGKTVYVLVEYFRDYNLESGYLGFFDNMIEAIKAKQEMDRDNEYDSFCYKVKECKVYNNCLDFLKDLK